MQAAELPPPPSSPSSRPLPLSPEPAIRVGLSGFLPPSFSQALPLPEGWACSYPGCGAGGRAGGGGPGLGMAHPRPGVRSGGRSAVSRLPGRLARPGALHGGRQGAGRRAAPSGLGRFRGPPPPRPPPRPPVLSPLPLAASLHGANMAHSCRWRFPARPGTTGGGGGGGRRGLGGAPRQRVPALLLPPGPPVSGGGPGAPPSPPAAAAAAAAGSSRAGTPAGAAAAPAASSSSASSSSSSSASSGPALLRVGPGFDAALQVSAAIGTNLRRFRAVFGESGGGGGSGEVRGRGTPRSGVSTLCRAPPPPPGTVERPNWGTVLGSLTRGKRPFRLGTPIHGSRPLGAPTPGFGPIRLRVRAPTPAILLPLTLARTPWRRPLARVSHPGTEPLLPFSDYLIRARFLPPSLPET